MTLSRKKKIIVVIFTTSLICFLFWFELINPLLSLYFKNSWPKIKDPSMLLKDCEVLLRDYSGVIENVYWPESVKALSPVAVYGEKEFLEIKISGGGVGPGWGYLVYPNAGTNIPTPVGYHIRESVYPGIFKYADYQH